MRKTLRFVSLFSVFVAAGSAHALPLDLDVGGVGPYVADTPDGDAAFNRFRLLTTELAFALSPRTMAPAETLGISGFELSVDTSIVSFNTQQDYWQNVTEQQRQGGSVPGFPSGVAGLHVRKGLPFSFEVEGHLSYLFNSTMLMMGADLRYSLLEGYKYVPNLAVRVGVGRLLNTDNIDMTTMNLDVTLSKTFPVGGVLRITPVVGWGMLFMNVNSGALDATPNDMTDQRPLSSGGSQYTFPELSLFANTLQRVSAGLRFQTWVFAFMYQFDGGFVTRGPFNQTHTFKLALDF